MKKIMATLLLGAALTFSNVAAAEEYIMTPGDQLQIYVFNHPDISSTRANADSSYLVRPDGMVEFPLIGTVETTGKTVSQFTEELKTRLSEFIVNPDVTVNVAKLGTTRVFVLGEVKKQGMFELTKSHRVLDALGAAGGFSQKAAKKSIYLIRNGNINQNGDTSNVQKLNVNNYLRKGDLSQNLVLNEGDCLFLTSNHKMSLNEIALFAYRVVESLYYGKRTSDL